MSSPRTPQNALKRLKEHRNVLLPSKNGSLIKSFISLKKLPSLNTLRASLKELSRLESLDRSLGSAPLVCSNHHASRDPYCNVLYALSLPSTCDSRISALFVFIVVLVRVYDSIYVMLHGSVNTSK